MKSRHRPLPYGMFNAERTAREAHSAHLLAEVYHRGQTHIWDGREVLTELLAKHGGVHIDPEKLPALRRLMASIFWGELAAWRISAALAAELEPLEARLAATSQAHDEARHFYVLHDYLAELNYLPTPPPPATAHLLAEVDGASPMARKLVGMQLMIEPIALTLFHLIRRSEIEPVLCDLLAYYERDEARHVALGVHHLPALLKRMRPHELADLWQWQIRLVLVQIEGLKQMEPDLRTLGFSPREVFRMGQARQLAAIREMQAVLGTDLPVVSIVNRCLEFHLEMTFPEQPTPVPTRLVRAVRGVLHGKRTA